MKTFFVKDAAHQENESITSFFVVASKQLRPKKNKELYLAVTLSDATGLIDGKMWEGVTEAGHLFQENDFVKIQGRVGRYNGRYEIVIEKLRKATEAEIDPADYLPATDQDIDTMWDELLGFVEGIQLPALRSLLEEIFSDEQIASRFRLAPAGITIHHACLGGLLEHVISLCQLCDLIHQNYSWLNRDLLIAGALLHDIGKIHELAYSRALGYSDRGQLVGHIAIGVEILHSKTQLVPCVPTELRNAIEHLILSHHGTKELGSPVEPAFAEAVVLHLADNLDAKLDAIRRELAGDNESLWTPRNRSLGRALLRVDNYLKQAG